MQIRKLIQVSIRRPKDRAAHLASTFAEFRIAGTPLPWQLTFPRLKAEARAYRCEGFKTRSPNDWSRRADAVLAPTIQPHPDAGQAAGRTSISPAAKNT
jgi:hypothetical protein